MIHRTLYKIQEFPSNIKHRYQRAKKGYSYQDVWSIDNWFVKIMPQMLTDLKNEVRGCPMSFTYKNGVEYQSVEQGTEEWKSVLDRMAFCFKEVNEDTCSIKNEFSDEYFKQCGDIKDWFIPYENECGEKLYQLAPSKVDPN